MEKQQRGRGPKTGGANRRNVAAGHKVEYTPFVLNPKTEEAEREYRGKPHSATHCKAYMAPIVKLVAWIFGESRPLQPSKILLSPCFYRKYFWWILVKIRVLANSWQIDWCVVASGVCLHQHLSSDKEPSSNQPYPRTKPHLWHRHNVSSVIWHQCVKFAGFQCNEWWHQCVKFSTICKWWCWRW